MILTIREEGIFKGGEGQGKTKKEARNKNFTFDFS
jgi:hypothetical protein